jgi:hypothetical protein
MKEYFGNYLGLVINSSDPEYRGRVQVFIPHIMPALYDDWNKEGVDIQISCVGSNIPEGLSQEVHARLVKILPWAESASPIIGGSAPGNLFSSMLGGAAAGAATGGVAGALVGAATGAANHFYNQSPTSNPIPIQGGDASPLIEKAKGITGLDYNPDPRSAKNTLGAQWGMCARGTTGLDKAAGLIDNNGASAGFDAASDLAIGGQLFQRQSSGPNGVYKNPYTQGTGAKYFQPAFTVDPASYKPQVGDSVFCGGGSTSDRTGKYLGHAQKCVGFDKAGKAIWVSDNPQAGGFSTSNRTASYKDFTVYRLNKDGLARYTAAIGGKIEGLDSSTPGQESTGGSEAPAPASPQTNKEGIVGPAPTPQQGAIVPTEGAGQVAGTTGGGGTVGQGVAKLATDRQAKFASELNDPAIVERLSYLAWQEVDRTGKGTVGQGAVATGTKFDQQANFIETVVNRAYFSGRSLTTVLNESAYGFKSGTSPINPTTKQAFDAVMGGRNNTSLATDNASNQANNPVARNRINNNVTGNWFRDGKVITDPAEISKLNSGQTPNGVEFFYTANGTNGFATGAGLAATKYAKENGIEMSSSTTGFASTLDAAGGASSSVPSVINNTDGNGRTPVFNTNDMAKGMFAYPNPGAMVWVFFREGNPLYPVYFAASYSSGEWQSAYRGSSAGNLRDHDKPGEQFTESTIQNLGALSLFSKTHISLTDPLENESVGAFTHVQGSGLTMTNGCDFYRSSSNRRDEVDNDRHIVTRGYKEEWVQGDASTNTRGDAIIKIGNISQEAIDAMTELSDMSYEANQKLMNKPK